MGFFEISIDTSGILNLFALIALTGCLYDPVGGACVDVVGSAAVWQLRRIV